MTAVQGTCSPMDALSPSCSVESMVQMYTTMAKIRAVEECIAQAYPQQKMRCPVHLSTGQEAIVAGICQALQMDDAVLGTHRSHGLYLAKGGNVDKLLRELHGKAGGCTQGRGGSMHLSAPEVGFIGAVPILGSSIAIATGMALAFQMRQEARVCVVFFGDGATEEGTMHESLQYAALKQLPIVYICENNTFSVETPAAERRHPKASLLAMAQAHGLHAEGGNGNTVLDVFAMAQRAIEKARQGAGPSFLEFSTVRWNEHCGPGPDPCLELRFGKGEKARALPCPLQQLETVLVATGKCSGAELCALRDKMRVMAQNALAGAEAAPWPDSGTASTKVYCHA